MIFRQEDRIETVRSDPTVTTDRDELESPSELGEELDYGDLTEPEAEAE